MKPAQELELLEMINSLPTMYAAPLPFVTIEDPFLKVPQAIEDSLKSLKYDYSKALGYEPDLDANGRMHVKDYVEMVDNLGIKRESPATIFKTIRSNDQVIA